jgi:hypothetical protein
MSKTIAICLEKRPWIAYIDDEREIGNSIIVTLTSGWMFKDGEAGGVRGFDSIREMKTGTARNHVLCSADT